MAFETISLKIVGTRPLLMHADISVDPLHPMTKKHKALTSITKKTDEVNELIARSEWRMAMYFDEKDGPYLPGFVIEAALVSGGKLSRLGAQLKRSIEVIDERCPLIYTGPRDVDGLWAKGFVDVRSVKVKQARLPRCRPMFREWATAFQVAYDNEVIDHDSVVNSMTDAGLYSGIGDYRPKFGRFSVEVL